MPIVWSSGFGDALSNGNVTNLPVGMEFSSYTGNIAAEIPPQNFGGGGAGGGAGGGVGIPITDYTVVAGEWPIGLILNQQTGAISGIPEDMDRYITEYFPPENVPTHPAPFAPTGEIGWPYASYGSARYGSGTATFTVKATAGLEESYQDFSITLRNNWTSDRNFFVRSLFGDEYLQQLLDEVW